MKVTHQSNFSSKFTMFLLNIAGIALPSQKYSRYINLHKYNLLQAFILLTSSQVVLLRNLTTLAEITISLVFINTGIFLNSITLVLHLKKKYIISMLQSINEDFASTGSSEATSSSVRFKKFLLTYGVPGLAVYLLALTSTVLLFPFSNREYSDVNAQLVPSAFPWTVDSAQKYLLTIGLQMTWLATLSVPVISNFMFSIYYVIEIRVQYDILCESIRKLNHSDEWCYLEDQFDAQTEDKVLQAFNQCVKHHQKILKFSRNFNAYYNFILSLNLLYSVPSLALILLSVVEEKSFSSIIRNVMTLTTGTIFILLFSSIGQTLKNENERFRLTLYEMRWYSTKSIMLRKEFLIVLCSTQRISSLQASNRYVASYELFFDILKLSYSYYNVIDSAFGH